MSSSPEITIENRILKSFIQKKINFKYVIDGDIPFSLIESESTRLKESLRNEGFANIQISYHFAENDYKDKRKQDTVSCFTLTAQKSLNPFVSYSVNYATENEQRAKLNNEMIAKKLKDICNMILDCQMRLKQETFELSEKVKKISQEKDPFYITDLNLKIGRLNDSVAYRKKELEKLEKMKSDVSIQLIKGF